MFEVRDAAVGLHPALDRAGPGERTAAVHEVLLALRAAGEIAGWRDEPYAVAEAWGRPERMTIERAAVPHFGVVGYGVHLNGFVWRDGALHLWVARRSRTKPTAPGELDQLVAGGQPAGIGLVENLVKECGEEAGIPVELARRARPCGVVTYALAVPRGFRPDVLFVFDLELPAGFQPVNADGEVEAFYLWPIERVAEVVAHTREFKFNCALVVIDFLVRRGLLPPEDPDYVAVVAGLRGREAFFGAG